MAANDTVLPGTQSRCIVRRRARRLNVTAVQRVVDMGDAEVLVVKTKDCLLPTQLLANRGQLGGVIEEAQEFNAGMLDGTFFRPPEQDDKVVDPSRQRGRRHRSDGPFINLEGYTNKPLVKPYVVHVANPLEHDPAKHVECNDGVLCRIV